jgi:protein phosphatase 2C family protein 2/3
LSSQEVVNFVRLKISEGTELREIGEMMCDHCLAPDSDPLPHVCYDLMCDRCFGGYSSINWDKTGHVCDNMTVVIVAILNGRTKEEWFTWVTDRVRQNYGYRTPKSLPYIYAPDRLRTFKARRAVQEEHDRRRGEQGSMSAEQNHPGIRSGLEALSIGGSADVRTVEVSD